VRIRPRSATAVLLLAVAAVAAADPVGGLAASGASYAGELPAPAPGPGVATIAGVPSYIWHHGCGPTSLGMVLGYWDGHGYGELIVGSNNWNMNRQAIERAIASPGHVEDYALYDGVNDAKWSQWPHDDPYCDLSEIDPGAAHANDSLADYARSSFSDGGMKYGWSHYTSQGGALAGYALQATWAVLFRPTRLEHMNTGNLWRTLTDEIDAGRPGQFLVDTDGNGATDHFVTVTGYAEIDGVPAYACYTTWEHDLHWFEFARIADGQPWGIYGGTFWEPVPLPEPAAALLLVIVPAALRRRRRGAAGARRRGR